MEKSTLLLLLGVAALAAVGAGTAYAQENAPPSDAGGDSGAEPASVDYSGVVSMPDLNARIRALLATIRRYESGDDYSVLYGGGHFSDFSRHPNVRVPFTNPATGKADFSTAAGAYQINFPTYVDFAARMGVSDFTPETQDAMALAILRNLGAVRALENNDVPLAFTLAGRRWASMPGSTAQQGAKSINTVVAFYNSVINNV